MLKLIQTPLSNIQQEPDEKNQQTSFCSTSLCCRMPPLVHILFDPVSYCFFISWQKVSCHKWRDQQREDGWTVWTQQILWSNAGEMDLHPPDSEPEHWPAWRRPIALWMIKNPHIFNVTASLHLCPQTLLRKMMGADVLASALFCSSGFRDKERRQDKRGRTDREDRTRGDSWRMREEKYRENSWTELDPNPNPNP